ncbi:flagellar hook capping FlgD N-terminal domain-containing protein [Paenibacillus lemnae]|uniref:Flagellar hook capping protein n=1 Tax=Paenibacillus lemnae TaxID=1330551 RepID=A0A848M7H0_PAELE|nr:flagellar hook capping FlgD N-terminal domain-containing protein [Paenibacillus lemnae]NMO96161.1 flagellar hook capping protein [Paenibacillus lemnae]
MASNYVTNTAWPNYSPSNIKKAGSSDGQVLGKDQFLSILITQLRYQDPMQPMQDKEFIAQMAQFTSLEQLMNISTQLTEMRQSLGAASSLIGQKVSWIQSDSSGNSSVKSGVVDSILIREGMHYARIGAAEVALDQIVQIEKVPDPVSEPGLNDGSEGLQLTDQKVNEPLSEQNEVDNTSGTDSEGSEI